MNKKQHCLSFRRVSYKRGEDCLFPLFPIKSKSLTIGKDFPILKRFKILILLALPFLYWNISGCTGMGGGMGGMATPPGGSGSSDTSSSPNSPTGIDNTTNNLTDPSGAAAGSVFPIGGTGQEAVPYSGNDQQAMLMGGNRTGGGNYIPTIQGTEGHTTMTSHLWAKVVPLSGQSNPECRTVGDIDPTNFDFTSNLPFVTVWFCKGENGPCESSFKERANPCGEKGLWCRYYVPDGNNAPKKIDVPFIQIQASYYPKAGETYRSQKVTINCGGQFEEPKHYEYLYLERVIEAVMPPPR